MLSKIIMIFSFGNWGKWKESVSRSVVSDSFQPHGLSSSRLLCPWNSPGMNTGVGSHSLLQGIFPTQGLNPGLPHCRRIRYHLSHQGSNCTPVKILFRKRCTQSLQLRYLSTAKNLFLRCKKLNRAGWICSHSPRGKGAGVGTLIFSAASHGGLWQSCD